MKVSELCDYCESIEVDCDVCKHKSECDNFQHLIEYDSPCGIRNTFEKDYEI